MAAFLASRFKNSTTSRALHSRPKSMNFFSASHIRLKGSFGHAVFLLITNLSNPLEADTKLYFPQSVTMNCACILPSNGVKGISMTICCTKKRGALSMVLAASKKSDKLVDAGFNFHFFTSYVKLPRRYDQLI